ncbi:lantibiotic modifying enzyme [Bacillus sp. F9_6S_D1_P_5]
MKLKEADSLRKFDEIIENIDQLTGEDARTFLKFIHGYLSIVEEGDGTFTSSDFVEKVSKFYKKDLAKVIELREEIKKSP